jgi:hypothetical protein
MAEDGDTQWKGYSAYKEVASQLHKDVNRAVKAYAHINSKSSQNVGITPQTAVNAKSAMLGISKRLFHEIRRNAKIDPYTEIYERWSGDNVTEDGEIEETDSAGYVVMLERADLTNGEPEWLGQMVDDLIRAAWKLGYIRSGVDKPADPDSDETQVDEMFD